MENGLLSPQTGKTRTELVFLKPGPKPVADLIVCVCERAPVPLDF